MTAVSILVVMEECWADFMDKTAGAQAVSILVVMEECWATRI